MHARMQREDRIAIALLALLVIAAFANVVFGGKSLVPSENWNPLDYRAMASNYGPRFVPSSEWRSRNLVEYPNYRDVAASTVQMEPSRELLARSLRRGEFPFWDPYTGGGTPLFATLIPSYFFPPTFLLALVNAGSLLKNIYILLLIVASGALTYFVLRRHDLSWPAAFGGAVVFAFSGAVIQTAPSGLGQPVALFSLPLLVTSRLVDRPGARRAGELALAFAFVALASFPPILIQVFGLCVVYLIIALARQPRELRLPIFKWAAVGIVTALAIAGVAYIPAVPVMMDATHVSSYYRTAGEHALSLRLLPQLLSPTIMGGAPIYADAALMGATGVHLYYAGAAALLLAGIGVLARTVPRSQVLRWTMILAGGLSLAKIFGIPPVQWIAHLPLLRTLHYSAYFGLLVAYAVAILAALGIDALICGRARKWHIFASASALAFALTLLYIFGRRRQVELYPQGWRWIADWRLLVVFSLLAFVLALMARWQMADGRWLWLPSAIRHPPSLLLLALLALEGITNSAYPRQRRWNIWQHPPRYVEILTERKAMGRVLPMPVYPANATSAFGHATLDSLTPFTTPRMFELYQRYFSRFITNFLHGTRKLPPERVLDAANVEYFAIIASDHKNLYEAAQRGYETLYADDLVVLLRRPSVPRYWFTADYRLARSAGEALEAVEKLPAGAVVIEQPVSFAPGERASRPPTREAGGTPAPLRTAGVRLTRFSLNGVELTVQAPRAGLLVLSESNARGWRATVDGRPAPILAANYAFRAVEVPAGTHAIRLRYHPPALIAGLAVTAIGIITGLWLLWRRSSERPAPET